MRNAHAALGKKPLNSLSLCRRREPKRASFSVPSIGLTPLPPAIIHSSAQKFPRQNLRANTKSKPQGDELQTHNPFSVFLCQSIIMGELIAALFEVIARLITLALEALPLIIEGVFYLVYGAIKVVNYAISRRAQNQK